MFRSALLKCSAQYVYEATPTSHLLTDLLWFCVAVRVCRYVHVLVVPVNSTNSVFSDSEQSCMHVHVQNTYFPFTLYSDGTVLTS